MRQQGNIFLVGPMGAGKSTIGRQLAKELGLRFVDSDQEIEKQTGASIPLIFELEGEEGFRRREKAMIERLTEEAGIVLATGGGAILDPDSRAALVSRGQVIYLRCSVDQQLERTRRDQNRPLLQTEDPRTRLEELMSVRDPLYNMVADLVVDTDRRNVRNVVKAIQGKLQELT